MSNIAIRASRGKGSGKTESAAVPDQKATSQVSFVLRGPFGDQLVMAPFYSFSPAAGQTQSAKDGALRESSWVKR